MDPTVIDNLHGRELVVWGVVCVIVIVVRRLRRVVLTFGRGKEQED
jgi:hypothetical protein